MNANTDLILLVMGVIVSAIGTLYGLKLTYKRDEVVKQAGIATTTGDSVAQIMRGFTDLNTSLQKENDRKDERLERLEKEVEDLKQLVLQLQQQLSTALAR